MTDTAARLQSILAECGQTMTGIPLETSVDQLGMDSLELLDLVMEIDREFDITLPIDDWLNAIDDGTRTREEVLSLKNIIAAIDRLRQ